MDLKDSVPAVSQPTNRNVDVGRWEIRNRRTLELDHFLLLRYCNQLRPEFDTELRPNAIHEKRERNFWIFGADRWIRVGQEALVGEAYE